MFRLKLWIRVNDETATFLVLKKLQIFHLRVLIESERSEGIHQYNSIDIREDMWDP